MLQLSSNSPKGSFETRTGCTSLSFSLPAARLDFAGAVALERDAAEDADDEEEDTDEDDEDDALGVVEVLAAAADEGIGVEAERASGTRARAMKYNIWNCSALAVL
jgi:hypothetical protein